MEFGELWYTFSSQHFEIIFWNNEIEKWHALIHCIKNHSETISKYKNLSYSNKPIWQDFKMATQRHLSRHMTKPTKWYVLPAKTQMSLGFHPVWSEPSLCAQWVAKDPSFLHADSKDSDQTGQIPRLIWVFAGHTGHFVGFVTMWLNWAKLMVHKMIVIPTHQRGIPPTDFAKLYQYTREEFHPMTLLSHTNTPERNSTHW